MLPHDFMTLIRSSYPKRKGGQGWADAERLIAKHVSRGTSFDEILTGTINYAKFCDHEGATGSEFVKQACTFYGPGRWWQEDYGIPKSPEQLRLEARWTDLKARAAASGFTRFADDPRISADVFESALRTHENEHQKPVGSLVADLTARMKR